ncbi:MAG: SDR family NAD(P)-dependent oxidoreductase [Alphaproteobacteria bacterium]
MAERALIVGAGPGLGAALCRRFQAAGLAVGLAARDIAKLAGLGDWRWGVDAADIASVADLFRAADDQFGTADVVVYNPSARLRGPALELDPAEVKRAVEVTAFGGFLVAQPALARMLRAGGGTLLFTGASASVKGYAGSAPFAMGKFALRGLAESLAREFHPQNIHIAHVVIDGALRNPGRTEPTDAPDSLLDPDAVAEVYWQLVRQPRSAWTVEQAVRPWVERF